MFQKKSDKWTKQCSAGANTWDTIMTINRLIQISDDYGHVKRLTDAAQTHSGLVQLSHYIFILNYLC